MMRTVAIHDPFTGPAPGSFDSWLETVYLGEHPLLRGVRSLVLRAVKSELPVLITGETGTGKDVIARAIHRGSSRGSRKHFVVSLAGLRETAWSVLFGHKQGAFTGSTGDHEGIFGAAHRSTIVFDDIDVAPLDLQPMLLRVIEHGVYRPLGRTEERHSDVRILATSNAPLEREIAEGRFRADLYQRLSVLRISLPPLRDHRGDIPLYASYFLKKAVQPGAPSKTVTPKGLKALQEHPWPRNVRELEHLLYRASIEVTGMIIDHEDVIRLLDSGHKPARSRDSSIFDKATLEEALQESGGNKREAARRLRVSPVTFYKLLKRHGVDLRTRDFSR